MTAMPSPDDRPPHPADPWALVTHVVGPRPRARVRALRRLLAPVCGLLGHRAPPARDGEHLDQRRIGWRCYDCVRCGRPVVHEWD